MILILLALIAFWGSLLQMWLGQPDTTPRLDNIHRFLAGIYGGCGIICLWTAITIQTQKTLVYLIALAVFLGACGRLWSIAVVGLPDPKPLWISYLLAEIILPILLVFVQRRRNRAS
jgi:hypothetical protein